MSNGVKYPDIRRWNKSVLPSDHGDGHDYGSCSLLGKADSNSDSSSDTVVAEDVEQQPLLKLKGKGQFRRSYRPSCCNRMFLGGSLVLILVLFCGAFFDSVYNEDKYNRMARRWAAEQRKHVQQRQIWDDDRRTYERDRLHWLREKEEHEADMEKWAREKAEEKRKKDAISWQSITPANRCISYNTREYTGKLSNIPLAYDAREECAQKAAYVNGKWVTPTFCSSEEQCGSVIGHWISSENEPSCQTVWVGPWDKGCQSPGFRHYHTILDNMMGWDNWHEMGMTTPGISLNGVFHPKPTKVETWSGRVWGVWFVPDSNCR